MGDHETDKIKELIQECQNAKNLAYCPYSHFRVGAALLTEDDQIIKGCNVENASYTLGICAERCAIFNAVSLGHKKFKALAVASDVKDQFISPCGACRQVIYEFAKDMDIYLTKPDLTFNKTSSRELLPGGFDGTALTMEKVDITTTIQ